MRKSTKSLTIFSMRIVSSRSYAIARLHNCLKTDQKRL